MDSPLARYLSAHDLGALQSQTALKEKITLPGGGSAPAWLCQTDRGLYIAGVAGEPGAALDLARSAQLKIRWRPMGTRLTIDGQTFTLPIRTSDAIRQQIALARLSAAAPHPERPVPDRRPFLQPASALETCWLSGALAEDEPLIAWMTTAEEHTFTDSIGGRDTAPLRFLLTGERTLLVAISRYGEVFTRPLTQAPLVLTDNRIQRDTAAIGEVSWRLSRGGLELLQALQRLPSMSRDRRLREAARLLCLRDSRSSAAALLAQVQQPDALDALSAATLTEPTDDDGVKAAIAALITSDADAGRLTRWVREWEIPLQDARELLGLALAALSTDQATWAIPLHRQVRDRQLAQEKDPFAQAAIDLELAEHLLICQRRAEVVSILEPRFDKLPNEDLVAVLPPPDADLTTGAGGPDLHIRTLELLAAARGEEAVLDLDAVAALARHQPLLPVRLANLAELDDPVLSPRAARAHSMLSVGGLTLSDAEQPPPRPLSPEQIERVRHPVARASGTMGWIQSALARVDPPDQSSLQDFCEQITPRRHAEVVDAVSRACVALGMPAVPVFISMGKKRVGLRSHERPEPFLLIGGDHLDESSEVFLRPAELRAAVGMEIAHLRFGHSRITSSDVWAGVWDKGTTAIEAAAFVLPFMKYIPVDFIGKQKTYETVAKVIPVSWLQQIYEVEDAADLVEAVGENIGKLGEAAGSAVSTAGGHLDTAAQTYDKLLPAKGARVTDVGLESAQVLAAHRTMQLTADRAGLLLSGDPVATVRAMCLMHTRLAAELAIAERVGLRASLARRGPDGAQILPELTLRIAALIAFYLSEEYTALSDALRQD